MDKHLSRILVYGICCVIFSSMNVYPISAASREIVDAVIAQVDDTYVYLSDLKKEEGKLLDRIQKEVLPEQRAEIMEKYQKQLIQSMIDRIIVEKEVEKLHFNIDERVDATLEQIMKENNISSLDELKRALSLQGILYDDFRKELRHRLMQQALLFQYVQPKIVVTHEEMLKYYKEHANEFMTPVEVEFYQLQVPGDALPESLLQAIEAQTTPEELQTQFESNPDVSLDHFGPVALSEIREEIQEALKDATPRQWTGPIELEQMKTWFWLIQKTGGVVPPFESVQNKIREKLWMEKAEKLQKEVVERLRKNHYIHIFIENLPEPYRTYYAKSSETNNETVHRNK